MASTIRGKAFVLGDNVDTDQIIPAKYLAHNPSDPEERKFFGMYALSGVPEEQSGLPGGHVRFVPPQQYKSEFTIVIGGKNFGCGSSREHAPLALAEAGAACVVAEFYARIFFRNSVNGGYLVPFETTVRLVDKITTGDEVVIDPRKSTLTDVSTGQTFALKPLGDVAPIIEAGGVFEYAREAGLIKNEADPVRASVAWWTQDSGPACRKLGELAYGRGETDPGVPQQIGESCGQCVVQMLAAEVGIHASLPEIIKHVGTRGATSARNLARVLNALYGTRFPAALWEAVQVFEGDRDVALYHPTSWAAMMLKDGALHWLAVRGLGSTGLLSVRDSADGSSYNMTWKTFGRYWNRTGVMRR